MLLAVDYAALNVSVEQNWVKIELYIPDQNTTKISAFKHKTDKPKVLL